MYNIKQTKEVKINLDYIELVDFEKVSYAKIYLNFGGSLQELILNNHHVIKDLAPLIYDNT